MEERKVPDIMFLGNDSNFSNKLMKLDSDLINIANNSRRQNSASRPKEEEKMYKDSQINHSKLIRQIEQMLNSLMIDFNIGLIVQMTLN